MDLIELRWSILGLLADKGVDMDTRLRLIDPLIIVAEMYAASEASDAAAEAYWNAQEQA